MHHSSQKDNYYLFESLILQGLFCVVQQVCCESVVNQIKNKKMAVGFAPAAYFYASQESSRIPGYKKEVIECRILSV